MGRRLPRGLHDRTSRLAPARILKNRLVFNGVAGNGTFLTNPSTCDDPARRLRTPTRPSCAPTPIRSAEPEFPQARPPSSRPLPAGVEADRLQSVPFAPTIAVTPGTTKTDSPEARPSPSPCPSTVARAIANSDVQTAQRDAAARARAQPVGGRPALQFCTDDQFGKGDQDRRSPVPATSKIGTVAIETPPLPAGSLSGNVFLGQQLSRDPTSGKEYRIFVDAESARYGISVRLVGEGQRQPADAAS